ncbi:MAG: condensin complex subunit 2-domain-containing protein [Olpidium bornovanus]|uniref:Condensin complex subunit 2 n=1 Tax=Olpidium bornovanus TaxID=278681 RepID=A0A8H7ZMP6_9FUNG|nr:MAG: condensin complex subunit 2-domain-containing protein [Olpidium bornovanus]
MTVRNDMGFIFRFPSCLQRAVDASISLQQQEERQNSAEDAIAAGDSVSPRKADAGGVMTGGEERRFVDVLKSVRAGYPPKLAGDISAAFCFMCLLHLANEKGLHIRSEEELGQLVVRQEQTV